jgi:hypothetical protein
MQTIAPSSRVLLPCETTYAKQVQEVLDSFKKYPEKTLKQYHDFMIALKYFEDLVFDIQEFEKRGKDVHEARNLTLNKLRAPLRNYEVCRDAIIRRNMEQHYYRS